MTDKADSSYSKDYGKRIQSDFRELTGLRLKLESAQMYLDQLEGQYTDKLNRFLDKYRSFIVNNRYIIIDGTMIVLEDITTEGNLYVNFVSLPSVVNINESTKE